MKNQSEKIHSLKRREEALGFCMYLGIGLAIAGAAVENLPELSGSAVLVSPMRHNVCAAEVAVGSAIAFWAAVIIRRVRSQLKKAVGIGESKTPPPPDLVVTQAKPSEA